MLILLTFLIFFMSKTVNLNDEIILNNLLSDLKVLHLIKGEIANVLFNLVGYDEVSTKKWHDTAVKMIECGTFVEYDTVDNRISNANFCRQRCCPMCQKRRSLEMYSRLKRNTEQMFGYELLHVVLTCRNCSSFELSDRISQMIVASRKLFNMSRVKQGFKGVARFIEVTYNSKSDDYHPHFHCLVLVKPSYFKSRYYIKNELLEKLWSDCMNEDCLTYSEKADKNCIAEVAKYCVKPFYYDGIDKNIKPFTIIYDALRNRRLFQLFGEFKKFDKIFKALEVDEPADFEIINPIKKFVFNGSDWVMI